MKLKCVLPKVDFVPMVKTPRFWIAAETVREGTVLEVDSSIGHQILASYPAAFQVLEYSDAPQKTTRKKKVESDDLTSKVEENL